MAQTRLLLVDDSAYFLDSLRNYIGVFPQLAVAGTAPSGEQAIALNNLLAPDVIVMDVQMPGIGGLAATRMIKALPRAPKVLVLTLHEQEEVRRAAFDAGADFFIVKDRLHDEFPAIVAQLAGGWS